MLYYYSYMLARIVTRQFQFTLKNRFAFGGSHGHQDYSVKIDKESPWIKYNSVSILLSRIPNWFALMECKTLTILSNRHSRTILSSTCKISHSSPGIVRSILNPGTTKTLTSHITLSPTADMSTEKIPLKQDTFPPSPCTPPQW